MGILLLVKQEDCVWIMLQKKTVGGAVAAMVIPDSVARYAERNSLFVLAQSGDSVVIRNQTPFEPKAW